MCKALTARSIMSLLERRVAVMVDEFIGLNEFGIFWVTWFWYMKAKIKTDFVRKEPLYERTYWEKSRKKNKCSFVSDTVIFIVLCLICQWWIQELQNWGHRFCAVEFVGSGNYFDAPSHIHMYPMFLLLV